MNGKCNYKRNKNGMRVLMLFSYLMCFINMSVLAFLMKNGHQLAQQNLYGNIYGICYVKITVFVFKIFALLSSLTI